MRETKNFFPVFTFYDCTGIQNYLEKKAAQGWLLEKIGNFFWKFRRIEPCRLHFAVSYFPKASAYDPEPSEEQTMFQAFCAHSGWVLADANGQMQIFYNRSENPVPIETDPVMELDNIHRSVKKSYLVTYWILLFNSVFQMVLLGMRLSDDLVGTLAQNANLFTAACWMVLLVINLTEILRYYIWRAKAKRAAEEDGVFYPAKGRRYVQLALLFLVLLGFLLAMCFYGEGWIMGAFVIGVVLATAIVALTVGLSALMKRRRVSAAVNQAVTMVVAVVLALAVCGVVVFVIVLGAGFTSAIQTEDVDTYEFRGHVYEILNHELPLTIEDMAAVEYDSYSYEAITRESVLLKVTEATQRPRWDDLEMPDLEYTIVEVKAPWMHGLCLNAIMKGKQDSWSEDIYGNIRYDEYLAMDPAVWGADAAYCLCVGHTPLGQYLLCYGDVIVEFDPGWEMTEEQMAIVGRIFREEEGS